MKLYIKKHYGIAPNSLLNSTKISLKAKGLFTYLQSKPDGWHFSIQRIANQMLEGKDAIRNALKELEKSGYLQRIPARNEQGKWSGYDYVLAENPSAENPTTENPTTENPDTLSKKDSSKKEVVKKNKESISCSGKNSATSLSRKKDLKTSSLEENSLKKRENGPVEREEESSPGAVELTRYFYNVLRPDLPKKVILWEKEVRSMKLLLKRLNEKEIRAYIDAIKNCKEFHCLNCSSPTYMYSHLQEIYQELYKK